MSEAVAIRAAATVLVLRDDPDGLQVYFLRRPARSSFAASAYVFPGGRVDDEDADPSLLALAPSFDPAAHAARMRLAGDDLDVQRCAAAHIGAVREVFEETGILLGTRADGGALTEDDAPALAEARREALDGVPFAAVLQRHGLRMSPERLVYVAHFITPEGEPRRYDTRFFAVEAPLEQEAAHHAAEATESGWYTAAQALEMAGETFMLMLPPTRIMCNEIARHGTVREALDDLGSRPVGAILFTIDDVLSGRLPAALPATWPPPGA